MKHFFLILTFILTLYGRELSLKDVNLSSDVLLIGTFAIEDNAHRLASFFPNENIFIIKNKNFFTVKIVNFKSKEEALAKLKSIKNIVPDALFCKKMDF
jgi:hypothetical protein